ncbi:hypothetical protein AZ28_2358 [Bordetella pertussis B200]|nr:hypothetical protein AZ28_2358 [Bordetella pertussis B200]
MVFCPRIGTDEYVFAIHQAAPARRAAAVSQIPVDQSGRGRGRPGRRGRAGAGAGPGAGLAQPARAARHDRLPAARALARLYRRWRADRRVRRRTPQRVARRRNPAGHEAGRAGRRG